MFPFHRVFFGNRHKICSDENLVYKRIIEQFLRNRDFRNIRSSVQFKRAGDKRIFCNEFHYFWVCCGLYNYLSHFLAKFE